MKPKIENWKSLLNLPSRAVSFKIDNSLEYMFLK